MALGRCTRSPDGGPDPERQEPRQVQAPPAACYPGVESRTVLAQQEAEGRVMKTNHVLAVVAVVQLVLSQST